MITISRRETFNAAHRLFREEWDDAKNLEVFGKCSHPNYHGHNYVLEILVTGEIDPKTGFVMDLKDLKKITQDHVIERFDHRNLNLDCKEFENVIPTTENIAVVIWNIIRNHLSENLEIEVRVSETEKNKVYYSGPQRT
ncbi:MAG: 6-carboxytetrahydropterin synthase [Crocinitomicaceae bacterium]